MTTSTANPKTKAPADPVRQGIQRVSKALEGLTGDQRQRVLRATGLAFGIDLTFAASPETKAIFDGK